MAKQPIPIRLPDDLEDDLRAFSGAHYDAPLSRIVGDALRDFIDRRLEAEPEVEQETRIVAASLQVADRELDDVLEVAEVVLSVVRGGIRRPSWSRAKPGKWRQSVRALRRRTTRRRIAAAGVFVVGCPGEIRRECGENGPVAWRRLCRIGGGAPSGVLGEVNWQLGRRASVRGRGRWFDAEVSEDLFDDSGIGQEREQVAGPLRALARVGRVASAAGASEDLESEHPPEQISPQCPRSARSAAATSRIVTAGA